MAPGCCGIFSSALPYRKRGKSYYAATHQRHDRRPIAAGLANQVNLAQVTSVSEGVEERHCPDLTQATEVVLEPEGRHHVDPARGPSVSLETEETHHCVDPEQASTAPRIEETGPARGTAVSTGTEDTHHIDSAQVETVSPSIEEDVRLDPAQVKKHFDRIGRFRILVIGRSNAGKTTILQRVCNTTELPEIFNAKGKKVKYPLIHNPSNR